MSKPILYTSFVSPGGRAVQFTAHYLNIDFDIIEISLLNNEQLTPEYLKLNPQHTVPVLNDNGVIIADSHAIVTYLINKHDPNNGLYPQDPVRRAAIDQLLYFDASVSFPLLKRSVMQIRRDRVYPLPSENIDEIQKTYELLEVYLQISGNYVAGDRLSLADFFTYGTFCALNKIHAIDAVKCPKILAWMERMTELPVYETIHKPKFDRFIEFFNNLIAGF